MSSSKNPWDVAQIPDKGDTSAEAVYTSVGKALTQWEIFETSLFHVFVALIRAEYSYPVERAYGAVLTFRGRMEMIEAAAEILWTTSVKVPRKKLESETKTLLRDAGKFAARRNEIAHGIVSEYSKAFFSIDAPGLSLAPLCTQRTRRYLIIEAITVPNTFTHLSKFIHTENVLRP